MAIVYMATNAVNGKRYIGVTKRTLAERKYQHLHDAKAGRRGCRIFFAAINKYGEEAFEWSILATIETYADALNEEIRLIAELKPEYNITRGGQGVVGVPRTPEWRANMSKGLMGRESPRAWLGKKMPRDVVEKRRATKLRNAKPRISPEDVVNLQKRIKELLSYDPDTGLFHRLVASNQHPIGVLSGNLQSNGFVRIVVNGRKFLAHRLAWLYVYGEWPPKGLYHINFNRADNRLSNLRVASRGEIRAHGHARTDNKLGVRGVRLHESGKYIARICCAGKSHYLGLFNTKEEAAEAYRLKAIELFGEHAIAA